MSRALTTVVGAGLLLFTPLLFLWATTPVITPNEARPSEKAVIFGAIVRQGRISPLHAERLDTGAALMRRGTVRVIVVSNAPRAADAMRAYLLQAGIAGDAIEIDGAAPSTPDSCFNQRGAKGGLILISQHFHLPRIALQCARLGVLGQYVAADRPRENGGMGLAHRWGLRLWRHSREAVLIWLELLGLYDLLSG